MRPTRYFHGPTNQNPTDSVGISYQRSGRAVLPFDETLHSPQAHAPEPDSRLLQASSREAIHDALGELSAEFREAIVLRELEGLSYKDIAQIIGSPIGTGTTTGRGAATGGGAWGAAGAGETRVPMGTACTSSAV